MQVRIAVLATVAFSGLLQAQAPAAPQAPAQDSGLVIRSESNLVLVDTVVMDKKGNYISDLKEKDFKVYEDGKEQAVKSFSYEADPASGAPDRKHYMVLVFDDASMGQGDQIRARQAASKFIDDNAAPNRMMTVMNLAGTGFSLQDFTADPKKLKSGIETPQIPPLTVVGPDGKPSLNAGLAIQSTLMNLRTLAKNMSALPGRKMLIMFTAGFPLGIDHQGEATALISECNRANIAIYPVDVRGVMTSAPMPSLRNRLELPPLLAPASVFQTVAFVPAPPFAPQARGGGAPAGGGRPAPSAPSAPSAGGRGGTPAPSAPSTGARGPTPTNPGTNPAGRGGTPAGRGGTPVGTAFPPGVVNCNPGMSRGAASPCNANRILIPALPPSAVGNQQVMFMLADGTGGLVIHDDNDILAGLEKIGREQNQYYLLGYTPPESKPGSCHEIKVKVDRGGTEIRSRSGYCSAKPLDVLTSTSPVTKGLEAKIADTKPGKVSGGMRAPYFYTSANVARVNLTMEIATDQLKFEKKKGGDLHSEVNLLGIAYSPQGAVAARFSDTVNLDYTDKDDADAAKRLPLHYENQFDMAPGKYTLKVVYSEGGDNYGRIETPLNIDPYAPDKLAVSSLALSKQYRKVSELGGLLDVALLEDKTPLIAGGLQIVPSADTSYSKADLAIFYVEMYEPLLASADPKSPPQVGIRMRVLDRKTGDQKSDTGLLAVEPAPPVGSPTIPFAAKIPTTGLAPGAYTFEFTVMDSANKSATRTADFDIQ